MTGRPHRVVLASAGTGKTYCLSGHFLALLLDGVDPDRVLATTFTRKAAGEILDRVFRRLLEAVEDPAKLRNLAAAVGRDLDPDGCRKRLADLARHIDRFRVRTLDAFFVQAATLFALDLGLPPGWDIAEEAADQELRAAAVARMLGEAATADRAAMLRSLGRGAASRSAFDQMLSVIDQGRALFLDSEPSAWDWIEPPPALPAGAVASLRDRLDAIEGPSTKAGAPNKPWQKALAAARDAVADGDWRALLGQALVRAVLEGGDKYASQTIAEEVAEVLGALARHGIGLEVAALARETAAAHDLLRRFETAYRAAKHAAGAYRFDDLPALLAGDRGAAAGGLGGRLPELWFRLGGRVDHLLLDEFQDTAPLQWEAVAPLAAELLGDETGGRSFFCVGDVKQSIYGWRAADARLLEGLPGRFSVLDPETMARSYRSSRVVLDTVNRVFARPSTLAVFQAAEEPWREAAARRFEARFEAHEPARELPGRVVCLRAEGDARHALEAVVPLAADRVAALAAAAPAAEIGVLVRSRRPIPALLSALRDRGLCASGEGGNPLVDAESVLVFLSALQHADHPGDTAAAFHVRTSPLAEALGHGPGTDPLAAARKLRARLVREGYGAVAAGLLPVVEAAGTWSDWDRGRFRQLVHLASDYDGRAGLRPAAFASLVRETAVEDPASARVRVMTIHASKGLEFDAVVLPELHAPLARQTSRYVSDRPDPYGPVARVAARPAPVLLQGSPALREVVEHAAGRELEDGLCILYVAMTRAARCLELILPPEGKKKSEARNFANWVAEALGVADPGPDRVVWRHPESVEDWDAGLDAAGEPPAPPSDKPFRLAAGATPRTLPARTASAEEGGAATAADLLRPRAGAAQGRLVHRWLESVRWIEDFVATDEDLLAAGARLEPDAAARAAALALLRRALEAGEVRSLLSRPAGGEDLEVCTELPFSVVLPGQAGDELWTGAIDRLVLRRAGGAVTGATVVDYKTDAVPAAGLGPLVDRYRPQLSAYRRAVAARYDLDPAAVACRLAFLAAARVVEV